jgi:hypothetical protein
MIAITYIGRNPGFKAKVGSKIYEFEWQKSLGIGSKQDEVDPKHANVLSRWKDRSGRKMFILE